MTDPALNTAFFAMPVVDRPRLRLVAPLARHIAAYQGFIASDRATSRGWGAMPHQAWRNFAALLGHWILRGFGPFVAEAKSDGRATGLFGPWHPEGQAEREVKWANCSGADAGQGCAFKAASAMLGHVFGALGWETAASYKSYDNDRSAALARRLGAAQDGVWTTPRGTELRVFRHRGQA